MGQTPLTENKDSLLTKCFTRLIICALCSWNLLAPYVGELEHDLASEKTAQPPDHLLRASWANCLIAYSHSHRPRNAHSPCDESTSLHAHGRVVLAEMLHPLLHRNPLLKPLFSPSKPLSEMLLVPRKCDFSDDGSAHGAFTWWSSSASSRRFCSSCFLW